MVRFIMSHSLFELTHKICIKKIKNMKELQFKKTSLIELNQQEMQNLNSGYWWIPIMILTALDIDEIKKGFKDGRTY